MRTDEMYDKGSSTAALGLLLRLLPLDQQYSVHLS
jgi:hypothetical protein